jgi:hypothetical protein
VEFRLLYEGQLGADRRPAEKHAIRRSFHPQLRHLWKIKKNLQELAERRSTHYLVSNQDPRPTTQVERIGIGIKEMGRYWSRAGFQLVPLVTRERELRCSLDILLLRPEEDRFIFTSGDIDGRLKTLFDALRMPDNERETGGAVPGEDETPLFCLLEDDRLISEVRVNTDQLLLLPRQKELHANDSFVVIHVKISHKSPGTFDQWFA